MIDFIQLLFGMNNEPKDFDHYYIMTKNNQNTLSIGAVIFKPTISSLLPLSTKI